MRSLVGDLLLVRVAREQDKLLHKRLYNAIRHAILDGSLAPESRLPASRDLAAELHISRNTVLTVYEQLLAEGYIASRRGSGTFVARSAPDDFIASFSPASQTDPLPAEKQISGRGNRLLNHVSASPKQWGAFIPGVPDVTAFPHRLFNKIQSRIRRRPAPAHLSYGCNGGTPELKQALQEYLRVARGVRCETAQILITEGIHQAIDLVTRMLCDAGEKAWVEEPSYWGIRHVLQMNDVQPVPVPVDSNGMDPPEQPDEPPRLIFVTPSHQYPLGAVMSLERRQRLLALARRCGCWIVEDDYDSEFRFSGQPIPALQGLIADAPVVYIGTFSKTLYPGLRLGYVVLPPPLAADLTVAHAELYRGGHAITQLTLAEFIRDGHYTAHIRRMRLLYGRRRQRLMALIDSVPGLEASEFSDNAGLHLVLKLNAGCDDVAIARAANARNILVRPLSRYYLGEDKSRGLLLGFAAMPEEEMEGAFAVLLACIKCESPTD